LNLSLHHRHLDPRDLHSSLHDALPIWDSPWIASTSPSSTSIGWGIPITGVNVFQYPSSNPAVAMKGVASGPSRFSIAMPGFSRRSEEHTSELQSRENLVCRLLLEKKNI